MIGLLKMFGKGILYVIGFPFFVAALLLFGVIGVFLFLFQLIKSIFCFFSGRKFFPELLEDKELRLMKERAAGINSQGPISDYEEQEINPNPTPVQQSFVPPMPQAEQPIYNNPQMSAPLPEENTHQKNVEKAVFMDMDNGFDDEPVNTNVVEEKPEEQNVLEDTISEEPSNEQEEIVEEPIMESEPIREETIETAVESKTVEEEILEEYVPDGSSYFDDADEEDTSSGVSIDYDL